MFDRRQVFFWVAIPITAFASQGCVSVSSTPVPLVTLESPTPEPTATIPPSSPTPRPASTPTVPSSLPTSTPATAEVGGGEVDLSRMEIVDEWTSTSPDGEWIAAGMVAFPGKGTDNPLANVRLVVSRVDGETVWTVIDEFQETGLGFPMPEPHRWSQDGKSFYFTHRVVPDGCSVFAYRVDLYRVDLEDGTVDELLPPYVQTLALSPDESQIAFIGFGERGLALKNLATGEERETGIDPGKSFNAGHLLWSPDGKAFAFTLAIDPCSGTFDEGRSFWAESTSILWMDAETLGRRTLLEEDPRLLVIHEWKENDVVTLMGEDENDLWEMDVETGEIVNK